MCVQASTLNLRERLLLAVRERDRRLAACRGQRGLLAAATPGAALLHHHDAAFFERLDGRRHVVVEQVEIARRDGAALKRLDELALANGSLGRRIVKAIGRKHHPAVLDSLTAGRSTVHTPSSPLTTRGLPPGGKNRRRHSERVATYSRLIQRAMRAASAVKSGLLRIASI